jgi:hypothetical protein
MRNIFFTINQEIYLSFVFRPVLQDISHCVLNAVRERLTADNQLHKVKTGNKGGEGREAVRKRIDD